MPPQPFPEPAPAPKEIDYPSLDDKLLADSPWQSRTMHAQFDMLSTRYVDDPNTYVTMGLRLYYTEGEPADMVVPDLFVSCGVPKRLREWYKVWEEGKAPDFVLEVSAEVSAEDNLGRNLETYARIGIREYCVYDPIGGLHFPRLQLFRLEGGVYKRVSGRGGPDGALAVPSETLGLEMRFEEDRLRLWDPAAREYLLELAEERAGRLKERAGRLEERAARERERARRLEERVRREQERARRERECARRIAAEQRVRELQSKAADLKERLHEHR